jgi:hypothetical protein
VWNGRVVVSFVAVVACALLVNDARADDARVTWLPGSSREIDRSASASRDTPVSGLVFAPRVGAKGAADFAFAKLPFAGVSLRPGIDAFFEIEHADPGLKGSLPLPGQGNGPMLWRGMYRFSLALSADALARAWLGARGAIEIAITAGHESDHVTGASFDDAPHSGDIEAGGGRNFIVYDVAMRAPIAPRLDLWSRIEDRAYWAGPILHAPGLEGGLRWHLRPHFEPVVSAFGEALLVNHDLNAARDSYFASLLAGVALPGALGELLPFTSLDAGSNKGLLINRHEVRWTIGVRYAPF